MEFNGKTLTAFGEFDNPAALQEHIDNKENPHSVTAAQVGAAPTGYGLGETSAANDSSWNGMYRNGFYRNNQNSPDGDWWYGLNVKYDSNIAAQMAFKRVYDRGPLAMAMRHRPDYSASVPWGEWEYVNPPMVLGQEYRTTERWLGKPVYTKLINCGALTNKTVYVTEDDTDHHTIIRYSGVILNVEGDESNTLPCEDVKITIDNMQDSIDIVSDREEDSLLLQIWYTM